MPGTAFLAPVALRRCGGWNGKRKPTPAPYLHHPTRKRHIEDVKWRQVFSSIIPGANSNPSAGTALSEVETGLEPLVQCMGSALSKKQHTGVLPLEKFRGKSGELQHRVRQLSSQLASIWPRSPVVCAIQLVVLRNCCRHKTEIFGVN
jgi:hypothetical protein